MYDRLAAKDHLDPVMRLHLKSSAALINFKPKKG